MEKLEDKNVKKLINKKINENELNRDNFAFFYYTTKKAAFARICSKQKRRRAFLRLRLLRASL